MKKLALIVAGAALGACNTSSAPPAQAGPAQTVEQYLDAIAAGEHEKAYQLLTADDRGAVGLVEFSKKRGAKFKVIGERRMSAEVTVETVGPDPEAFKDLINELMEGRHPAEELKRKTREALANQRIRTVPVTMHYLVIFEEGAWRVAAGYAVQKKVQEASEDPDAFSGSLRGLLWAHPALEKRVGPMEDLIAELTELRRQNARLWEANHRLLDQAIREQETSAETARDEISPGGRVSYEKLVEAKGPHEFLLHAQLADLDIVENIKNTHIIPTFADGHANGFKLFSIRPGSLLDTIGVMNGDIIKTVDGIALNNPSEALRAYQQVINAKQFRVTLQRGSEVITLQFTVGD